MSTTARELRQSSPRPAEPRERAREESHLRVVERSRRQLRLPTGRRAVASVSAVVAVVMFGLVYLHVELEQRQVALDRLQARTATAEAQYQQLRLQVAQLESPSAVISAAEGRLGMRPPAAVHYVSPPPVAPSPSGAAHAPAGGTPVGDADWPTVKSALDGQR